MNKLKPTLSKGAFLILLMKNLSAQSVGDSLTLLQDRLAVEFNEVAEQNENSMIRMEENLTDPRNINELTEDELNSISCLNHFQSREMIAHRNRFGAIICWEELQMVNSMDKAGVNCLKNTLRIAPGKLPVRESVVALLHGNETSVIGGMRRSSPGSLTKGLRSSLSNDFNNDVRTYLRIRHGSAPGIKIGLNMEKDPGEPYWTAKGPDHIGYFIQYQSPSKKRQVIAGDYELSFGQGLLFGQGYFSGITGDLPLIKRSGSRMLAHSSMDESRFLRGLCLGLSNGKWEYAFFASYRKLDGAITSDSSDGALFFRPDNSGLHQSEESLAKNNTTGQACFGAHLGKTVGNLTYGAQGFWSKLEHLPEPGNELYELFKAKKNTQAGFSMHYQYVTRRFLLYGEAATDRAKYFALINGLLISLDKRISIGIVQRMSSAGYNIPSATMFSDRGVPGNESGWFGGINIFPNGSVNIQAFADIFHTPWLQYATAGPARGNSAGIKISVTHGKKAEAILLFRKTAKQSNIRSEASILPLIGTEGRTSIRLQLIFKPGFEWQLRYRFEAVFTNDYGLEKHKGAAAFQDLRYQPQKAKFNIVFRTVVFKTDNYYSAIYAQEGDVLFSRANGTYYGSGIRIYLLSHLSLTKNIDGWIKLGKTASMDREFENAINGTAGAVRNDISLQFRFRFQGK